MFSKLLGKWAKRPLKRGTLDFLYLLTTKANSFILRNFISYCKLKDFLITYNTIAYKKKFVLRLREIRMSEYDAHQYEEFSKEVRKQVNSLRIVLDSLQVPILSIKFSIKVFKPTNIFLVKI